MFNKYMWETYLSASGSSVVSFFEANLRSNLSKDYAAKICDFHKTYCPSSTITAELQAELSDLCDDLAQGCCLLYEDEYSISSALTFIQESTQEETNSSPQKFLELFTDSLAYFTTQLAIEIPDLFVPYYFKYNYNIFEKIAQEFDIQLPEMPAKKNYTERYFFYGEICAALYDFREMHNMSPYELCAFLYDFAPKYVGGTESYIIHDLPNPKSAYFIGGSANDRFATDVAEEITPWQCNPETMAGDMIVMYLKSPVSAIDSVWRSISIGFNDPFFYYYRCTYISKSHKINQVSLKTLQQDPVLNELPIVKKNMQGLNGVELYPTAYNHILDLANADLPRLEFSMSSGDLNLSREKDVENQLIKPFLSNLGYDEKDYLQQLYIEIGNHNHALIPDFVINPVVSKGHQSAAYLIEAKYSISTTKLLEEAKTQARGYAKLLNAHYSVIAAKEGIWVTSKEDDYSQDVLAFTWDELKQADNFHRVFHLLGKGKI